MQHLTLGTPLRRFGIRYRTRTKIAAFNVSTRTYDSPLQKLMNCDTLVRALPAQMRRGALTLENAG